MTWLSLESRSGATQYGWMSPTLQGQNDGRYIPNDIFSETFDFTKEGKALDEECVRWRFFCDVIQFQLFMYDRHPELGEPDTRLKKYERWKE